MLGVNTESLENFLLEILSHLEINKDKNASFELFLGNYDKTKNGPRLDFDSSWKALYKTDEYPYESALRNMFNLEKVNHSLWSLIKDLVVTKEVRSQPSYKGAIMLFDWDTEGGIRF